MNIKKPDWTIKKCAPCEGGVAPLSREEALQYIKDLKGWFLSVDSGSIRTEYIMKDFAAAIRLIERIAKLAEKEDHHPDIHLTGYRKLSVELSTHAIGGLSDNDFILAAKIGKLPKTLKKT